MLGCRTIAQAQRTLARQGCTGLPFAGAGSVRVRGDDGLADQMPHCAVEKPRVQDAHHRPSRVRRGDGNSSRCSSRSTRLSEAQRCPSPPTVGRSSTGTAALLKVKTRPIEGFYVTTAGLSSLPKTSTNTMCWIVFAEGGSWTDIG